MKRKKKMEFSKLIMLTVLAITIIVVAFTLFIVRKTQDLSPLAYLIPAVFAELSLGTGFYYNKSKKENLIKLRQKYGSEIYNDTKEF